MDSGQTITEQSCGRIDQNGQKYAHDHIPARIEIPTSGSVRERTKVRYNQQCEEKEMVLGRAHQQPQCRPMDLACHNLETIIDKERRQGRPAKRWRDDRDKKIMMDRDDLVRSAVSE